VRKQQIQVLLALLVILSLPAILLSADDNIIQIKGKVLNPEGIPVSGAGINILETGHHIYTDDHGRFVIPLPAGSKITLRVFTDGYEEITSEPLLVSKGFSDFVTLQFKEKKSFGEVIVITGTRNETMLQDVPVRTEVITADLIEKRQSVNLADALDGLSGLRVENNCQNCGFNQLRINGLDGGYSSILMDGMDAFSSMTGVYGLEQIPSIIVDRVEVVKGGGSVLYGAGAVGGVVNVITKEPISTTAALETSIASRDGEFAGILRGYGSWVHPDGHMSAFAFGSVDKANEYDRDGDGYSELGRSQLESAGGKFFSSALGDSAQLQLGFDVTHEWRRGGDTIDLLPEESTIAEYANSLMRTATINWNHFVSDNVRYSTHAVHSWNERDSYYGGGFDPLAYGESTNPHTTASFNYFHTVASHSLALGGQYEREEIEDVHASYNFTTRGDSTNYGVYAQDEFSVGDRLTIVLGLRYDDHSQLKDGVISPRASAMYRINDQFSLRSSYSFGFKAPVVFDEDLHITIAAGEPMFIKNAEDLVEESAHSYSISLEI
jgi:outer membrane receptor for ferrienterochelin and colicins